MVLGLVRANNLMSLLTTETGNAGSRYLLGSVHLRLKAHTSRSDCKFVVASEGWNAVVRAWIHCEAPHNLRREDIVPACASKCS